MADKTGELNAYASGGPNAAADYRAAQSGVSAQRAQALQDASNRSGAAYAPAEFRAQQATRVGAPLDASIQGLGAMGNAAGQYQGAQNAAQAGFISNLNGTHGLVQDQLRQQSAQDNVQALNDVNAFLDRQQAQQDKLAAAQDKQKKALDAQNQDFVASQKEVTRQNAAMDSTIDANTYSAVDDILKSADDMPTALRLLQTAGAVGPDGSPVTDGSVVDKTGDPIDTVALLRYVQNAYAPIPNDATTALNPNGSVATSSGSVLTDPQDIAAFKAQYSNAGNSAPAQQTPGVGRR